MADRPKLDQIFAWVLDDEAGETIATIQPADGSFIPLIGDDTRAAQWAPAAQAVANATGRPVRLAQFTFRVDRQTLLPEPQEPT